VLRRNWIGYEDGTWMEVSRVVSHTTGKLCVGLFIVAIRTYVSLKRMGITSCNFPYCAYDLTDDKVSGNVDLFL
jgi:hypothetical protein